MIEIRFLPALLFCSGTLSLFLAGYTLNRRRSALTHLFVIFAGAVAVYAYGYGLELLSHSIGEILFWSKVQYLGVSYIPGLMLAIAACYTGKQVLFSRWKLALVFAVPVAMMLARLSNPVHHLFYRSATLTMSEYGALLNITPGPFYLVHALYSILAWMISILLLARFYRRTAAAYKRQTLILIAGSGLQFAGYLMYLAGLGPDGLDLNPLLLVVTVPMYALGILRFSLFSLAPVARETVFEEMRDGVVVVDTELRLVDFNRRGMQLFPAMGRKRIGFSVRPLFKDYPELNDLIQGRRNTLADEIEIRMDGRDGPRFFRAAVKRLSEPGGRKIGGILTFTDMTSQKNLMEKLARLATMDELTGIYNRRHLMELGEIEIQRYARSRLPLAVLVLDLDRFKSINDTWGHQSGDRVLKAFAVNIRRNIRATDIFGRFGGEEFMIIMPDTPADVARETARRLCRAVKQLAVSCDGDTVRFTVSIGVAGTWCVDDPDLDAITHAADKALYRAKQDGRDRFVTA